MTPKQIAKAQKLASDWRSEEASENEKSASSSDRARPDPTRGEPQDAAEAMERLRRAAEQGNAAAQCNLGAVYAEGLGMPQDDAEAAKWFRLSADQGDASAQFNLGNMYRQGRGVPQDQAEAVR